MSRIKFVIILGATGTGKSRLAIQLAKKFNGEIIGADSMQVYEELDITSNKVTQQEREEVPHYLVDICKPTERFSVLDYRNLTLPIIDDILKRGKLPIIVGGTNYYIESVLWKDSLLTPPEEDPGSLYSQTRRVFRDPGELDEWRTYKECTRRSFVAGQYDERRRPADEYSKRREISVELQHHPSGDDADSSLSENINQLVNSLECMKREFVESVRNIVAGLKITEDHYRRTFYRLPDFVNLSASADAGSATTTAPYPSFETEFATTRAKRRSVANIVAVENQLLDEFLCECLGRAVLYYEQHSISGKLADEPCTTCVDPSRIWNAEKAAARLLDARRASCSLIVHEMRKTGDENSEDNFCTPWLRRLRHECCQVGQPRDAMLVYQNMLTSALDVLGRVIGVRLKRLKLIKIIDDVEMADFTSDELHAELKLLDLESAQIMHPNNRRKIIRAIQLLLDTGKSMKQMYQQQRSTHCSNQDDRSLRYPDALLLWLRCDPDVLEKRLHTRVVEMVENGLVSELEDFHETYNVDRLKKYGNIDYTKGIFQSIGLKEFHSYLMLDSADRRSEIGQKELNNAMERLKVANFQYAKSQNRFIINKFIQLPDFKRVPTIFELNCTDLKRWHDLVETRAETLVDLYLKGDVDNLKSHMPVVRGEVNADRFINGAFPCEICHKMFTNKYQWYQHCISKSHKKCLYKTKIRKFQEKITTLGPHNIKCSDEKIDDWSEYLATGVSSGTLMYLES